MEDKFTLQEWGKLVYEANDMQYGHPYLRFGQCLFNIAYYKKPNLVNTTRGTLSDPFHRGVNEDHESVQAFKNEIVDLNK